MSQTPCQILIKVPKEQKHFFQAQERSKIEQKRSGPVIVTRSLMRAIRLLEHRAENLSVSLSVLLKPVKGDLTETIE